MMDGNVLAVGEQETHEYQVVTYSDGFDGEQLTQVIDQQQEYAETQQYHIKGVEGQQDFHHQETQQVYVEGQEYHEQEMQEYVEGQEQVYQQHVEEYQHIEGREFVEGQEQEYQIHVEDWQAYVVTSDGQGYQEDQETQVYEGQEAVEFYQDGGQDGQQQQGTQILDENAIHELIAFHSVDADGSVIENAGGVEGVQEETAAAAVDEKHVDRVVEHSDHEHYVENAESTEEEQENAALAEFTTNSNSSALQIQEAIFNPNTGTLEPITSASTIHSNTFTAAKAKVGLGETRNLRRTAPVKIQKKGRVQNSHVKFTVAGEGGQQIKSLQGLLQVGGNTITLSGESGKQQGIVVALSSTPGQNRLLTIAGTSPAKILRAPAPVPDQQQVSSSSAKPRYMLKQGNLLTPISAAVGQSFGATKIYQMQGSSGTNQVPYVRVVSNKPVPTNKIPIAPSRPKTVAPRPQPDGQTIVSLPSGTLDIQGSRMGNFVVLPSNYVSQPNSIPVPIRPADFSTSTSSYNGVLDSSSFSLLGGFEQNLGSQSSGNYEYFRSLLEPNGIRPRKPCNCTKSQCLKLYCDCFANGEFCHLCNCTNCLNNLNYEEERQKAIKLTLERNPAAFRPKIGKSLQTGEAHERKHSKGCNCRRSGCVKNYCECYEAKIFCSSICKCNGCKNCIENIPSGFQNNVGMDRHFAGATGSRTSHRPTLDELAEAAGTVRVQQQTQDRKAQDVSPQNNLGNMIPPVILRAGTISNEVITSAVELLLAKAETGQKQNLGESELERRVLEEYSECLACIVELGTTVGSHHE